MTESHTDPLVDALQRRITELERQLDGASQLNPAEMVLIDALVRSVVSPFTAAAAWQAAAQHQPLRDALDVAGIESTFALGKRLGRLAKGGRIERVSPKAGARGALWGIRRDDDDAIVTRSENGKCPLLGIRLPGEP
jgi:hypothetical protein